MKRLLIPSVLFLAAGAFCVLPLAAAEPAAVSLRYSLAPEQTNAYSMQVELLGDNGREAIAGTFVVGSRAAGSNLVTLSWRGQLRPKSVGAMPPMMGYRPGYSIPLSAYSYGPQSEPKELTINERGDLIRQAGDLALPLPLGQLMASLFQPLPAEPTTGWETEKDVFILDEPLLQGPATAFLNPQGGFNYMPYSPGRSAQGVLAARQKTRVKVTEVTAATVTLQRTLSLDSRMLTGQEPRVSAVGEGQIVLDRAGGLPQRVELDCKTVVVTENLSRRSMVTLRWQLLQGAEREKAIAPPPPSRGLETKFKPQELTKLLEQLRSEDTAARQSAARELSSSRLEVATPELVSQMISLANDPDDTVRNAALTILANHGTRDQVPLLIKALSSPDANVRAAIVKGLGRLKDPRAIEPLVNLLAAGQADQPFYRPNRESAAADALVRIGSPAEPAVLTLLKEKNVETRCQACNVLKQIGTRKSLAPLKELTLNPSKELSEAAAEACRSIQARETK
jgi:hypothetical protein